MSNLEVNPEELRCNGRDTGGAVPQPVEMLPPRAVPLGGPRAMAVRRTLPQRQRSLIGAWCFVDHYGPDDVSATGGMDVPPHPHTGLQTVTWLFTGEIEHRDSLGSQTVVRPGELNLMTGGYGICHSEVSMPDTTTLHGMQLWVALPDVHRHADRDFQHYAPAPVDVGPARLRVFLGSLAGETSPVHTFSKLLGAEIELPPAARVHLDVDPSFEHGLLVDTGALQVGDTAVPAATLAYLGAGRTGVTLTNCADTPARGVLLGGEPLDEEIVMWWNFVARSHDEIVADRQEWERESDRFGHVDGYQGRLPRLPAPPLPEVRLRPRGNGS